MPRATSSSIEGSNFNGFRILKLLGRDKAHKTLVRVVCPRCGSEFEVRLNNVKSSNTTSCGCHIRTVRGARFFKHGLSSDPRFQVWVDMMKRCHNPKDRSYFNYGARGITVCDSWRNSVANFLRDMGKCPPGGTLERVNNELGYEPSNCVWATMLAQQNNKRTNIHLTWEGVTLSATQWARRLSIPKPTLLARLHKGYPLAYVLGFKKVKRGQAPTFMERTSA